MKKSNTSTSHQDKGRENKKRPVSTDTVATEPQSKRQALNTARMRLVEDEDDDDEEPSSSQKSIRMLDELNAEATAPKAVEKGYSSQPPQFTPPQVVGTSAIDNHTAAYSSPAPGLVQFPNQYYPPPSTLMQVAAIGSAQANHRSMTHVTSFPIVTTPLQTIYKPVPKAPKCITPHNQSWCLS